MTAERVFGTVFALLGVGMFYLTGRITQAFPDTGDPGPRLLPTILSLLMILLGALLALRMSAAGAGQSSASGAAKTEQDVPTILLPPPPMARRLGIGGAFVAFLALFEPLGFSLSSTLFLAISMSLMDALTLRRIVARSLAAMVMVVMLGLLLAHVLKLPVPGIWFA